MSTREEKEELFWKKRRLKIYTKDEYGTPHNFIVGLPIFFHNRLYSIIEKVELIDEEETPIQTIEYDKKKTDNHDAFQQIATIHELRKENEL